ncbi:hypothetical protein P3T25_008914 [Paraburkholderia sp. GAS32]
MRSTGSRCKHCFDAVEELVTVFSDYGSVKRYVEGTAQEQAALLTPYE